jgi:simple sugar transport system ATP-binding protein
VKDVSLTIRGGEIVGIAGVAGNGQRELAETIVGMRPVTGGAVQVCGRRLGGGDPREAISAGVAYVPEDRLGTGVAPGLSIASNIVLKSYRGAPVSTGPMLRFGRIRDLARGVIDRYDVRTSGPNVPAWQLSGGNLQKVVLAREFSGDPAVLVAASPTRGLDVAGIETVHSYLRDAAATGVGVLLISEDLDEILAIADRVAVMYEGSVVGEREVGTATVEELGLLMAGGESED